MGESLPENGDNVWVVAHVRGKRKRVEIGPPTEENQIKAENKRKEWELALTRLGSDIETVLAPTFEDAAHDFLKRGLLGRAAKTQDGRRYQMNAFVGHFGSKRIDQRPGSHSMVGGVRGRRGS